MNQQKGTATVPFSFLGMANEALQSIEKMVVALLADEPEYFCVSLQIIPTNNVKLFLDGNKGLPIEQCVRFNRRLCKMIEEAGIYPEGEYSMEVSSPGIDEPLMLHRQYLKNIGRSVEITSTDGSIREGKLLAANETDISLEQITGKGKKAITETVIIPFTQIKTTTVQIKF